MFCLKTVFLVPSNDNKWAASSNPTTCWVSFLKPSHKQIHRAAASSWGQEEREEREARLPCYVLGLKAEPRSAGAPGSSAPHLTTEPDYSGKKWPWNATYVNISKQSRYVGQHSAVWWQLFIPNISISLQAFRKAENPLTKASVLTRLLELALHVTQE